MKRRLSAGFYWLAIALTRFLLRIIARRETLHAERVPAEGPVVIVANHLNRIDPVLVSASTSRRLHTMAKRELFETPLVGWTLWAYGAFPVRRYSADIGALRAGRNHLRSGRAVLVHPEGTRSNAQALQPALPGSAMMALLGGAPVLPVAITGTEAITGWRSFLGWLRGRRIRIRVEFGEPFELTEGPPTADRAEVATDLMMRKIAELLPESYRGAYGPGSEGKVVVARQQERPAS